MSEKTEKVYVTIDEDRKEFLDTRNRYADIARKLANEFDRTFIMLI
jgi:HD-like signal output (HDOD) protein